MKPKRKKYFIKKVTPTVAISDDFMEYQRRLDREKEEKENKKQKRKVEMLEKKEQKEALKLKPELDKKNKVNENP